MNDKQYVKAGDNFYINKHTLLYMEVIQARSEPIWKIVFYWPTKTVYWGKFVTEKQAHSWLDAHFL